MKKFLCIALLLLSGCQSLQAWDRVGMGIRIKTTGWIEQLSGIELEFWMGAERVPRKEEIRDDLPNWFNESVLRSRLGFDDLSTDDRLRSLTGESN